MITKSASPYWVSIYVAGDLADARRNIEAAARAMDTIDDRALTFHGAWPSVESLLAFQPWFKRVAPVSQVTKEA